MADARTAVLRLERFWKARGQPQAVLVPDEALGALTHESVLRNGRTIGTQRAKREERERERETRRTLLWADTHSTLPSTATHFSRPHCIRFGSSHWTSTCTNEQAGTVKTPSLDRTPSLDARPSPIPSAPGRLCPSPMRCASSRWRCSGPGSPRQMRHCRAALRTALRPLPLPVRIRSATWREARGEKHAAV